MSVAEFPFRVNGINQVQQILRSAEGLIQFQWHSLENCTTENKQTNVLFLWLSPIKKRGNTDTGGVNERKDKP